jgi:transcriptional regulator with XRE-family HTH domain
MQEQFAAQESNKPILMGARLRQRREAIGMSVQGLAERMDVTETWIHEVESGRTASAVTINQWIDLVWATQKPWPDERRLRSTGKFGWTAFDLLAAAEDIVRRHINSTEQPGSGDQDP